MIEKGKRIGIDARFMLRPLRGIPLYVTRLCQYLPALNRNYLFYLFINKAFEHNDRPENYQPRIDEILRKHDNVRIINHNDDAEIMWEQVYLPRLIKEHKIDLLHMPANRICFFSGVPTVVTLHDVMEYIYLPMRYSLRSFFENNIKMFLYKMRMRAYIWAIYKIGMRRAAKIITVSNYSSEDIKKTLGINSHKIKAIYHGIDEDFLGQKSVMDNVVLSSRSFVLMLGGDSYQKNPEGAIAAWANVAEEIRRRYPLKIVGFCGNKQSPLIKVLERYGLINDVEIKGWVSQDELIEHFRNAALFLYLSRYEGFGLPLLQAMASGTPVISTNRASLPEVLGNVGFQFDPGDYEGIAGGIEKILSDDTLWAEQARSGIERAPVFCWQRSAEEHFNVYEEVLRNV